MVSNILGFIKASISTYIKLWLLVLLPFVLILLIFFLLLLSHRDQVNSNKMNILKVREGMSQEEVLKIMGDNLLTKTKWEDDSVYSYEAELFSSTPIEIIFDERGMVKNVIVSEGLISPIMH